MTAPPYPFTVPAPRCRRTADCQVREDADGQFWMRAGGVELRVPPMVLAGLFAAVTP